jgi:hypothetical protein
MREHRELLGPGLGGVEVAVDLGEDAVKDQVLELLLVAHVAVERARDHPKAGGQDAHGQRPHALLGDDGERLGDHAVAGEWGWRSPSGVGGLNHSVCDSRWWSVGSSGGAFPLVQVHAPMFTLLNIILDSERCLL